MRSKDAYPLKCASCPAVRCVDGTPAVHCWCRDHVDKWPNQIDGEDSDQDSPPITTKPPGDCAEQRHDRKCRSSVAVKMGPSSVQVLAVD
jgi:hypothetical protein